MGQSTAGVAPRTSSEVDETFIQGMRDRMEFSLNKYGPVRDAYPHKVNAIKSMLLRLEKYNADGNTEHLIDAANYCMIEFMCPAHPEAHFAPTDAKDSPGRKWHSGGRATQRGNKG